MWSNGPIKVWSTSVKTYSHGQHRSTAKSSGQHRQLRSMWTNHILALGSLKACQMVQSNVVMWSLHLPHVIVQSTATSPACQLPRHQVGQLSCHFRHQLMAAGTFVNQRMSAPWLENAKKNFKKLLKNTIIQP